MTKGGPASAQYNEQLLSQAEKANDYHSDAFKLTPFKRSDGKNDNSLASANQPDSIEESKNPGGGGGQGEPYSN